MKIKKLFKKKSFKLSLVFVSLIGMLASGGHSFAKYRDENYGNGNAGTAKFGVKVSFDPAMISLKYLEEGDVTKWYVFIAKFNVSFEESEVKLAYDLNLKFGSNSLSNWNDPGEVNNNVITFEGNKDASQTTPYTLSFNDDQSFTRVTENVMSTLGCNLAYSNGTCYYARGKSDESYTWHSTKLSGDILSVADDLEGEIGETHYYQVMFFLKVQEDNEVGYFFENAVILYDLIANQIGG